MKGFLFDENLTANIEFTPTLPVEHVTRIKSSPTDTEIWEYAKKKNLAIVTKDADFSDRIVVSSPPPKIIHLKFGNLRKKDFHSFLNKIWIKVESLIRDHKLVNVYFDSFKSIE